MNILRPLVFFLYTVITLNICRAELPNKLFSNIQKAKAEWASYDIVFKRAFKFPLNKDTIFETYSSSVSLQDPAYPIGFHKVEWTRSGAYKSFVAVNDTFLYRVNFPAKVYYTLSKQDRAFEISQQVNPCLFHPFTYTPEELKKFEKKGETDEVIKIYREDTIRQSKLAQYFQQTEIWISKSNYLPIRELIVSNQGQNTQYALYELISINKRELSHKDLLIRQTDSVIKVIRTYNDADSIKKARLSMYKDLKLGDTIRWFSAIAGNGDSIHLNLIKDSILILDFFYTTCKPCLDAIPTLSLVQDSFRNKGVLLMGINILKSDWKNLPKFNAIMKPRYLILRAAPELAYEFNVRQYPRLFIIKNGILMKVIYGYTKGEDNEIIETIQQLMH